MFIQEFYLFCFFCLGFVLFRSKTVRAFLDWGDGERKAKGKGGAEEAPAEGPSSLEHLRAEFSLRRYEGVLMAWPLLESATAAALSLVVTSLMALGRVDDVGLELAKAVARLPHLRATLHETIEAMSAPACEVKQSTIAAALRNVFDRVRDDLSQEALEALLSALARVDEEQRVSALLQAMLQRGRAASQAAVEAAVDGFLQCSNLDAALKLARSLLPPTGPGASRSLVLNLAQTCMEDEAMAAAQPTGRARSWDALELLESGENVPTDAWTLLVEHIAQLRLPDLELADRVERRLRESAAREGLQRLPLGTFDALVRIHAGAAGNQTKAYESFQGLVETAAASGRLPSEGSVVGMISACVDSRNVALAEHLCRWALTNKTCTLPVFAATVKVIAATRRPEKICELYEVAAASGLEPDDAMYGQLIKVAVQCQRLELARHLFKLSENPDAQNYMSLMRACSQEGRVSEAVNMLWDLASRGLADTAAYNSALDACVSNGDREAGRRVFEGMKASGNLDIVSYNILLKQHVADADPTAQIDALFREMDSFGLRPNVATYNSLLGGALATGDFRRAWQTIDVMEGTGPGIDAYTISILFKGYKGKRSVMDATSFDRALELIQKYSVKVDEVLVNVALEACVGLRDPNRLTHSLSTFRRCGWVTPRQCTMHTYAMLIKAYGQSNQLNMAWKLWSDITCKKGLVPSEQLYGQMIDVLVTHERLDDALQLFEEMKATHRDHLSSQGFAVAYAMIIKGFAQHKECARALQCYEEMKGHGTLVGLVVFNTLIDACSRVGDMDSAARLFHDMMDAKCVPDLITYSTLIKGYCVRGELDQAMELFSCMRRKGIQPDAIVFNSLLDGCAKKQMPALCEQVIKDMEEAGVKPSNHSASILIKLYGRRRDLDAAFQVINEMPRKYGFRPNAAVYTCLMSTCIANSRMDLAMNLRKRMLEEGTFLDEKTYSTLLRGALRSNSVESCWVLINAALDQGGRRLLDEELAQGALALIQRRRLWDERGQQLLDRLRGAGLPVYKPEAHTVTGVARPHGGPHGRCFAEARGQRRYPPPPQEACV